MMESEVLNGTALLVLGMPNALREESRKLPRVIIGMLQCFYRNTPARGAVNIEWNAKALEEGAKESPDAPEELAVVQFNNAAGVRFLLSNSLELVSAGHAMGLELRRGYIKLGPHRLLVEGVVKPETPGEHASAQSNSSAKAGAGGSDSGVPPRALVPGAKEHGAARAMDDPTAKHGRRRSPSSASSSRSASSSSPSTSSGSSTSSSASASSASGQGRSARRVSRRDGADAKQEVDETQHLPTVREPRVLFITLRRLYMRPDAQTGKGDAAAAVNPANLTTVPFPVTPYMLFEMVRPIAYPRKILVIPSKETRHRAPAAAGLQVVNALVEVASPEDARKITSALQAQVVEFMSITRSARKAGVSGTANQHVEARFTIQMHLSVKRNRRGVEEVQKEINAARANDDHTLIVPPVERLNEPRWRTLRDTMAMPSVRQWVADDRSSAARATNIDSPAAKQQQQQRQSDSHGAGSKRDRSPESEKRERGSRRHEKSRTSPRMSAMSEPAGRDVDGARFLRPPTGSATTATQPGQAPASAAAVPGVPANVVVSVPPPPPPPLMSDHLGPLPFGWRPVFSQEYQQVYYVHRDAASGEEKTTWERPQFEKKG